MGIEHTIQADGNALVRILRGFRDHFRISRDSSEKHIRSVVNIENARSRPPPVYQWQDNPKPTIGDSAFAYTPSYPLSDRPLLDRLFSAPAGYLKKRFAGAAIAASFALAPFLPYASVKSQDANPPVQEVVVDDPQALPLDGPSTLNVTHAITVLRDMTSDYEDGNMPFIRRDANNDGVVNIADPIYTAAFLFGNGEQPSCLDAADSNANGILDLSDVVHTLLTLHGVVPPIEPVVFPAPDPNGLSCKMYDLSVVTSTTIVRPAVVDRFTLKHVEHDVEVMIRGVQKIGSGLSGAMQYVLPSEIVPVSVDDAPRDVNLVPVESPMGRYYKVRFNLDLTEYAFKEVAVTVAAMPHREYTADETNFEDKSLLSLLHKYMMGDHPTLDSAHLDGTPDGEPKYTFSLEETLVADGQGGYTSFAGNVGKHVMAVAFKRGDVQGYEFSQSHLEDGFRVVADINRIIFEETDEPDRAYFAIRDINQRIDPTDPGVTRRKFEFFIVSPSLVYGNSARKAANNQVTLSSIGLSTVVSYDYVATIHEFAGAEGAYKSQRPDGEPNNTSEGHVRVKRLDRDLKKAQFTMAGSDYGHTNLTRYAILNCYLPE